MPEVPPRNYALEILELHRKADVDALAVLAQGLATSLAVADGTIAEMRRVDAERRAGDAERQRRKRGRSRDVTGGHGTSRDSLDGSPHPSLNPTSPSSSSAREALSWQPEREARLARRLVTDAGRVSLAGVLAKCEDKTAVAAEIGMILDGGRPGVSRDPAHMELALADYLSNGMSSGRFNAAHFRRHVQKAAEPPTTNGRRGGTGQRSYDNAVQALKDLPEAG